MRITKDTKNNKGHNVFSLCESLRILSVRRDPAFYFTGLSQIYVAKFPCLFTIALRGIFRKLASDPMYYEIFIYAFSLFSSSQCLDPTGNACRLGPETFYSG